MKKFWKNENSNRKEYTDVHILVVKTCWKILESYSLEVIENHFYSNSQAASSQLG